MYWFLPLMRGHPSWKATSGAKRGGLTRGVLLYMLFETVTMTLHLIQVMGQETIYSSQISFCWQSMSIFELFDIGVLWEFLFQLFDMDTKYLCCLKWMALSLYSFHFILGGCLIVVYYKRPKIMQNTCLHSNLWTLYSFHMVGMCTH